MYDCANQNSSTTSDGSIVTTLMPHESTFGPGVATSSLQTDATQGSTPNEPPGVNDVTTETGTLSAENSTTPDSIPVLQGKESLMIEL